MELLGYQLLYLGHNQYDASVVARYEQLGDILAACKEKNLDIILISGDKFIVECLDS